jgi:hypothetical protein
VSKALRLRRRKIDDAKLKELWQSRKTEMEIGQIMGHDPSTLRRRAIKIGLPSSRREIWKTQT